MGKETRNQMGLSCSQENSVLFESLATLHNLSADPLGPKIESLVSTPRISLHVMILIQQYLSDSRLPAG
jgi:hypothetical protein